MFLPKTLDRVFQIPGRMIFLPIWVFGLKTSDRVFCIKNSSRRDAYISDTRMSILPKLLKFGHKIILRHI